MPWDSKQHTRRGLFKMHLCIFTNYPFLCQNSIGIVLKDFLSWHFFRSFLVQIDRNFWVLPENKATLLLYGMYFRMYLVGRQQFHMKHDFCCYVTVTNQRWTEPRCGGHPTHSLREGTHWPKSSNFLPNIINPFFYEWNMITHSSKSHFRNDEKLLWQSELSCYPGMRKVLSSPYVGRSKYFWAQLNSKSSKFKLTARSS